MLKLGFLLLSISLLLQRLQLLFILLLHLLPDVLLLPFEFLHLLPGLLLLPLEHLLLRLPLPRVLHVPALLLRRLPGHRAVHTVLLRGGEGGGVVLEEEDRVRTENNAVVRLEDQTARGWEALTVDRDVLQGFW